jgi:hypothetical protein
MKRYFADVRRAGFDIGVSAFLTPLQDACDRFPVGM